ncbi:MAG: hypothetical protein HYZ34_06095 [Ignavibacteriae bacterium]|nr:hypothetical protein [Ignavibacteriota bacterium]
MLKQKYCQPERTRLQEKKTPRKLRQGTIEQEKEGLLPEQTVVQPEQRQVQPKRKGVQEWLAKVQA